MKTTFNDDPQLGAVVSSVKPFCMLMKNVPVPLDTEDEIQRFYNYIVGDFANPLFPGLAGHKWSRLCGFTFTSNRQVEYPKF